MDKDLKDTIEIFGVIIFGGAGFLALLDHCGLSPIEIIMSTLLLIIFSWLTIITLKILREQKNKNE